MKSPVIWTALAAMFCPTAPFAGDGSYYFYTFRNARNDYETLSEAIRIARASRGKWQYSERVADSFERD